jgi:hypothetical protein
MSFWNVFSKGEKTFASEFLEFMFREFVDFNWKFFFGNN